MTVIDNINFTATLMCQNTPVGRIKSHRVEAIEYSLLPLYFQRGGDFGEWLRMRAIDSHRTNSRLLKKALRLKEKDDISTALHFHAVTITDMYWVKPEDSNLEWEDVRFDANDFDTLALTGDLSAFSKHPSRTPELTNIGSFEKCWRYEDGSWWMYKQGSKLERFSELFVCELCKEFGYSTAKYENADNFVRTKDFTGGNLNFESAFSLVGDDEDYIVNYDAFFALGMDIADQYVALVVMDTICRNADRHTHNYGVLRDLDGNVVALAPNFDNNISLVSRGYDEQPRQYDLFGRLLAELEDERKAVSSFLSRHPLPTLSFEMVRDCCVRTGIDVDINKVWDVVSAGYRMVQQSVSGME